MESSENEALDEEFKLPFSPPLNDALPLTEAEVELKKSKGSSPDIAVAWTFPEKVSGEISAFAYVSPAWASVFAGDVQL